MATSLQCGAVQATATTGYERREDEYERRRWALGALESSMVVLLPLACGSRCLAALQWSLTPHPPTHQLHLAPTHPLYSWST